ncbi:hypothetical protein [Nocardioides speluncae]|uniref:hypothetical protein n=1 Tax=Nocardioides speluncae TaxID=2670337 RepID=UPI000D69D58E|nr:hypothetical protein [Nocardioides speluncae]
MGWKSFAACATVVVATLAPAYAQADPKPKPPPTPPSEPTTADCTLGAGEWQRCLAVDATLNHAPKVGQRAVLTVRVRASADLDDVDVSFALPQMLVLKKAPYGFTTKPGRGGAVRTAAGTFDLRAGDELRFKAHVGAVAEGEHSISVAAVTGRGLPYDSETVYAPLIVGSTPQTSQLGYREGVQRAARTAAPVVRTKAPYVASQPVAPSKQQYDAKRRAGIQAVSCVRGRFVYREGGQERPAKNLEAQAWDEDSISDDQLGVDLLDGDGRFEVCFENDDGIGGGGQDLYLRFATKHARFTVTHENGDEWIFRPPRRDDDIADGETIDFGTWHPANPDHDRALITFDAADNADVWTPGRCWDRDESDCRNFEIRWPDNASQYTWDDTVHITNDDGRDRWVVTHEVGHAVMDNIYQDFQPDVGPDCLNHGIWSTETAACAWVEGFADWYAWTVRNNPNWGTAANVENQVWGDREDPNNPNSALRPTGDHVEGRVAGALWDLQDAGEPAATAYWDHWNEGSPFPVWETFLDHRSSSFDEFWRQRRADGYATGDDAAGALYQNTIDKDFRNPLASGRQKVLRSPQPPGSTTTASRPSSCSGRWSPCDRPRAPTTTSRCTTTER